MRNIAFIILFVLFSLCYAQKNRIVNGNLENIINEPYNLPCTGSQSVQAFNIEWNNAYGWKNFKGVSNLWGHLRDIESSAVNANANTVIFQADSEIVLGDNFIAEHGKELVAFIADCIPKVTINYSKKSINLNSKLTFYTNDDLMLLESNFNSNLNLMDSENDQITTPTFHAYAYPSPFFEEITLETNNPCFVRIYDILGNELYHYFLQDKVKISTDVWSKGVYIIEFFNQNFNSIKQKIVKL